MALRLFDNLNFPHLIPTRGCSKKVFCKKCFTETFIYYLVK